MGRIFGSKQSEGETPAEPVTGETEGENPTTPTEEKQSEGETPAENLDQEKAGDGKDPFPVAKLPTEPDFVERQKQINPPPPSPIVKIAEGQVAGKNFWYRVRHPNVLNGVTNLPYPSVDEPTQVEIKDGVCDLTYLGEKAIGVVQYLVGVEKWIDESRYPSTETIRPESKPITKWTLRTPNSSNSDPFNGTVGVRNLDESEENLVVKDNLITSENPFHVDQLLRAGYKLEKTES